MELVITTKSELSDLIQSSIRSILNDQSPKQRQFNELPDYLPIDKASEYLHIPIATLYQYCSARKIPFIKRGKRSYFLKSDLDQWMLSGRKLTIKEIQHLSNTNKGGKI